MPQGENWLTTEEIAKDLKVNVNTVRRCFLRVKQRTRNLHSDQSFKGTWGSPKRRETHGDGVSVVLK
jgi:hypothetical protein